MYKLIVLFALVAVALAEPGFLLSGTVPAATSYSSSYRAPVVKAYAAAPIYASQPGALTYAAAPALYNPLPYPYGAAYIH